MISHRSENARTLAALLGLTEQQASKLLDVSVIITFQEEDEGAAISARFFEQVISMTVQDVTRNLPASFQSVEVVFGAAQPRTAQYVRVTASQTSIEIGRAVTSRAFTKVHKLILLLAACYASAQCLKAALSGRLKVGGPLADELFSCPIASVFGRDHAWMSNPITIDGAFLAGAGAVGNGFLFALSLLDARGTLNVVDPDNCSDGNLNRCVFFSKEDVGRPKAEVLCAKLQPLLPKLILSPRCTTLAEANSRLDPNWLKTLIVAVDSRRARRNLQTELPGEVFDASTTGVVEVALHHHKQPTGSACLGCIYEHTPAEDARESHIAEALGVSLPDVKNLFVDEEAARKISKLYPHLLVDDLQGKAYDSLFKELCSEAALKSPSQHQVFAPFGFVSIIAGIFLAVEVVRRNSGDLGLFEYNYWRVSPWAPQVEALKQWRESTANCVVCGVPVLNEVRRNIWSGT